jgi:hypothetical protein
METLTSCFVQGGSRSGSWRIKNERSRSFHWSSCPSPQRPIHVSETSRNRRNSPCRTESPGLSASPRELRKVGSFQVSRSAAAISSPATPLRPCQLTPPVGAWPTSTPSRAGAEVKGAPHPQAATAWLDFIHSPAALEIFERFGFKPYTVG